MKPLLKTLVKNCFRLIKPHVLEQVLTDFIKGVHSFQPNRQKGPWHQKGWEPLSWGHQCF